MIHLVITLHAQNNQLNKISKGNVEQGAHADTEIMSDAFCRVRQEPCQGDDCNRVQRKYDCWVVQARCVGCDSKRHEYEQHIEPRSGEYVSERE
jgi:hypothetical protein